VGNAPADGNVSVTGDAPTNLAAGNVLTAGDFFEDDIRDSGDDIASFLAGDAPASFFPVSSGGFEAIIISPSIKLILKI